MFYSLRRKPVPWPVKFAEVAPTHRALWDGLVLAWPMWSKGPLFLDDVSGNQLHGTIPSAMGVGAWQVGEEGPELNFGGVSTQFITVADPTTNILDGTTKFSLEVMFRPDEVASDFQGLVAKYRPSTGMRSWRFYLEYDELEFQFSDDGTGFESRITSAANLAASTLYQAVVTYDGTLTSPELKIYVNGVNQSTSGDTITQTSIYGGTQDLIVGQRTTSGGSSADTYDGQILSVRIWVGRVLSATDVQLLYDFPWRMYDSDWGLPSPAVIHTGSTAAGPWILAGTVAAGVEEILIGGLENGVEYDLQAFTFDEVPNVSSGSTIIQETPAAGEAIPISIKTGPIQRPLPAPFIRRLL